MDNFDDKYKKKNPFTTPDSYFDGVTDRIMERLDEQEKPRKMRLIQVLKPYMGLVAIFMLALLVVQVLFPLVVDKGQLIRKETSGQVLQVPEGSDEDIFDSQFNPTSEEIMEYLAAEVDNYELMYAGIY